MHAKSNYVIFSNKTNKTLVFYPCPKNANTSVKLFLAKHIGVDNNFSFIGDNIPKYQQDKSFFEKIKKNNLVNFLPTKQIFQKINVDEKLCITRDPVERFISAYSNRVLYHRDKAFANHSLDEVIEKLENNLFENKHFLPQNFFLGKSLEYYTFSTTIKKLSLLEKKINNFFGKNLNLPRLQTGGNNIKINLSSEQVRKIKKIYLEDYNLIQNIKT